jgi:hypothetical protein
LRASGRRGTKRPTLAACRNAGRTIAAAAKPSRDPRRQRGNGERAYVSNFWLLCLLEAFLQLHTSLQPPSSTHDLHFAMTTTAQLPREAILYSLTPAQPSGHVAAVVAVVGLSAPNAHAPLLTLRSAVPAPGAHALARLGAAHVVHADAARALLHIHALPGSSGSSGALAARCIPAAPLRALAASHAASAALAASSAADGHVWLWDPRGRLCASWQAAYRPVTCLAWTDDDDFLISAGDDSRIAAWSVAA